MQENEEILKIITNETKDAVDEMVVVTPSIYASMFSKFAISHDTAIENEELLSSDLLDQKVCILENLQKHTSVNAQKLSDHTDKAINAIKDKDETLLSEILQETQKLREEIEKLKESVYKDELTHSFNRKWLHDKLIDDEQKSFKTSGVLAMIDLNYFKIINDKYGHVIGDKVLIFIANQLKRTKESVIRYGGDEFIIVFSKNTTEESALAELNKIREAILTKSLKVKDISFKVSFSFGLHKFNVNDTLSEIISRADKNMYADKIQIKERITGI